MEHPLQTREGLVMIIESLDSRRLLLASGIRGLGLTNLINMKSVSDALTYIGNDDRFPDWIIAHFDRTQSPGILNLMATMMRFREFHQVRVSIIIKEEDREFVPLLFQMGAFSVHHFAKEMNPLLKDIDRILDQGKELNWRDPLLSAEWLRPWLRVARRHNEMVDLEMNLLKLFPDHSGLIVTLADALHRNGRSQAARATLARAANLDANTRVQAEQLMDEIEAECGLISGGKETFAEEHDVKSMVIVDPDVHVRNQFEEFANILGIQKFHAFADGKEAWEAIQDMPSPPGVMVMEWKVPGLSGMQLVQRIRKEGQIAFPLFVHSSLVKSQSDITLIREMGVTDVITKPQSKKNLLQAICAIVAETREPTEMKSVLNLIRLELRARRTHAAMSLYQDALVKFNFTDTIRLQIEAELAYLGDDLHRASNMAIEAIQIGGGGVELFNLLGKIYLKLKQYDQANQFFEKANQISPENIERLCSMSEVQHAKGDKDKSATILDRAQDLDSDHDVVIESGIKMALANGDHSRARELMRKLKDVSSIVSYMNNKAVALVNQGVLRQGVQLYQDAIGAIPDRLEQTKNILLYNFGLGLVRQNLLEGAREALVRSVNGRPGITTVRAKSLLTRVERAIAEGGKVTLRVEKSAPVQDSEVNMHTDSGLPTAHGAQPGQMRLHLIYQSQEPIAEEFLDLVAVDERFKPFSQKRVKKKLKPAS